MSEPERANLSLGVPPESLTQKMTALPGSRTRLLVLINVVILALLVVLLARSFRPSAAVVGTRPAIDAAELKAVALGLEERGLSAEAAAAWEDYLEAEAEPAGRAEILYRIGNHLFEAEEYDGAAAALVRAELAAGDDRDIKAKIGTKLVECLRRMGRYGELRREVARQVEVGSRTAEKTKVLARLAGDELTEADLDRMIERQVDNMLTLKGASPDEKRRKAILQQFSTPQARQQMLHRLLQSELCSRRARELKLDRQEEFIKARDQMVENLLADRFLAGHLEKIQPSSVDIESFYKANLQRYRRPESIRVVPLQLATGEDVSSLLKEITSAEQFHEMVRQRRDEKANPAETPLSRWLARGRKDPQLGDTEALFRLSEGQWTKKPHVCNQARYLVLVEEKAPPRTPPLEEVDQTVRNDYLVRKQEEVSEQLVRDLMTRYDVQIAPPEKPPKIEDRGPPPPAEDSAEEPAKSKQNPPRQPAKPKQDPAAQKTKTAAKPKQEEGP